MILVLPILLGVGIGWLRRGSLRDLADLPIRFAWVPLLAVLLQAAFVVYSRGDPPMPLALRSALLVVTYCSLIAFLALNHRLPGTWLLLIGASLNALVMFVNGGYMPVTQEALIRSGHEDHVVARGGSLFVRGSKDIVLEAEVTRLGFLSDVIGIPEAWPFSATFSVGDVFIGFGAGALIASGMMRRRGAVGWGNREWIVNSG